MKKLQTLFLVGFALLLSGCKFALLDPKGQIAASQKHLFLVSVGLMLLVVIPVIILSFVIPWRYRAKNTKAVYKPNWSHSTALEIIWWAIPCVIIAILAWLTWVYTHKLDPYRPLDNPKKPLKIEAIALSWKWLFIYPKQNIATVNYLMIPVDQPVRFYITSDAPMNSLEIPRLAGQIYAMTGMQTKLNIIANHVGTYKGFSSNFSGEGFSGMRFKVGVGTQKAFDAWVHKVKQSHHNLSLLAYNQLTKNSVNNPVEYFASAQKNIFKIAIMKYMGMEVHGMAYNDAKLAQK